MDFGLFIIAGLAIHRVARLIVMEDGPFDIFKRFRLRIANGKDFNSLPEGEQAKASWVVRGFHCPLCVSFWLGILAALVIFLVASPVVWFVFVALALSDITVIIHRMIG